MSARALIAVDGRPQGGEQVLLSALDEALLQGVGVFDTMRVLDGVALFMEEHLQRFLEGLERVGIELPCAVGDRRVHLERQICSILARWDARQEGSLRVLRTWGSDGTDGRTIAVLRPLPERPREVSVSIAGFSKDSGDALEGVKGMSRLRHFVARRQARAQGHYDALIATARGDLCEATAANLFAVRSGIVATPPLESGCLAGVTRQRVLAGLGETGLSVRITAIHRDFLRAAEEVFLTNSSCGVLALTQIAGLRSNLPGAAGPAVQRIRSQFEGQVAGYLRARRG